MGPIKGELCRPPVKGTALYVPNFIRQGGSIHPTSMAEHAGREKVYKGSWMGPMRIVVRVTVQEILTSLLFARLLPQPFRLTVRSKGPLGLKDR